MGDRLAAGGLDLLARDVLQPGDQPERHRHRRVAAGAEQQHRGLLTGAACLAAGGGAAGAGLALAAGADAGGSCNPVGIEDHDHRAVAQDGVAAEHRDVAQDRRHRLDHDLLGVEHAVDDDAQHARADLGHHDMRGIALVRLLAEPQQVVQVDQRQQPVAQAQHRRAVDPLDHGLRNAILLAFGVGLALR